jgi:hypothetical protein
VLTLDGRYGDEMELKVWGPGAAELIGDVMRLAGSDFGYSPSS